MKATIILISFLFLIACSHTSSLSKVSCKDSCYGDGGRRVGITSNITRRKKEWKRKYPNMCGWEILRCGLTYTRAQKIENEFKKKGCDAHPGGRPLPGYVYCVYTFKY